MLDPVTGGPYMDSSFQTSVDGIFAAGNVVHVYDLVDWVTEAGYIAGKSAALYAQGKLDRPDHPIKVSPGENVRYAVPQKIDPSALLQDAILLQLRAIHPIESPVWVEAVADEGRIIRKAFPYARPGEMISLNLKPDLADKLKSTNEIKINIIER